MSDTVSLAAVWVDPGLGWMRDGACADRPPDLFFPGGDEAHALCAGCLVRAECLTFALANNIDYGTWGGTSQRQRRKMRKERRTVRTETDRKDCDVEAVSARR